MGAAGRAPFMEVKTEAKRRTLGAVVGAGWLLGWAQLAACWTSLRGSGVRWVSHCTSFVAGPATMHPQTLCGALASQALQEDCPGAGLKLCWSHPLPFGPAGLHPAKAWHVRNTWVCVWKISRDIETFLPLARAATSHPVEWDWDWAGQGTGILLAPWRRHDCLGDLVQIRP